MIAMKRAFGAAKGVVFEDDAKIWSGVVWDRGFPLVFRNKCGAQVGYANLTPDKVYSAAVAFKGPQALGAPSLDCGQFSSAPAVCNDQTQFFEYAGAHKFTKVAGWTKPPANESGQ